MTKQKLNCAGFKLNNSLRILKRGLNIPKKSRAGFTLIELLVVIFIISIATGVAMLSIGQNENRKIKNLANELYETLTLAEEQAILRPATLGLSINDNAYRYLSYEYQEGGKKKRWLPLTDNILGVHSIPDNVYIRVKGIESNTEGYKPKIIFSINGEVSPFKIEIGRAGKEPRFIIEGDEDGKVSKSEITS